MAMWRVTKNPPLACYYLALVGSLSGWGEPSLHLAMLLPAVAAVWGTYRLAERLCGRPLLASLVTLWTPAFLVSCTSVMCDTLIVAFWVWALVCWLRGLDRRHAGWLVLAGLLVGLAG